MTRSSARTDECERAVLDALGDDLDELLEHLDLCSDAIIDAGSYPLRIKGLLHRRRAAPRLEIDPGYRGRAVRASLIDRSFTHHDATPDASDEESARWYSARSRCS